MGRVLVVKKELEAWYLEIFSWYRFLGVVEGEPEAPMILLPTIEQELVEEEELVQS